ncbi:YvrJ family protein [Bacillus pumilus]|uniref:YvrJ family protein n=1 Tax=Bacillus pumilus TaxID=1408 RepID=UPI0035CEE1A5
MENFFSEEWLKQLGQAGFPVILTIYLLTRFERKFDELSKLIQQLVAVQKNDESD